MTRTMITAAAMAAAMADGGCVTSSGDGTEVQGVAGPGGVTVKLRDGDPAGQLAVNWSSIPASAYNVYQSRNGAAFAIAGVVFDSGGGPPATSFIADGLDDGTQYCFQIQGVFDDGSTTQISVPACAITVGCTVNVNYASQTSSSIGVVSLTGCDAGATYTGALSVVFGGQTRSLGAWNPVCGRQVGLSLGIDFGAAATAVFTLAVAGPGAQVACSTTLALRH